MEPSSNIIFQMLRSDDLYAAMAPLRYAIAGPSVGTSVPHRAMNSVEVLLRKAVSLSVSSSSGAPRS
ncbi:hypothetical protein T4E_7940 [Trichinella pseudospiralis]|uniref:Uncharacterized protein n=1 Tax=Trichinella pseudospiralis TaxID=6337 RepID=A0A0V0XEC5_TRIPS|nr:hypothetical protein T4E_7940 [Trichinella pseudospiralis]